MRKGAVSLVLVLGVATVALVTAVAAGGRSASSAGIKIPLPAPNQAKVSRVTVQLARANAPASALKVVAKNAVALGGRQLNSQVVYVLVRTKPPNARTSVFEVWVFVHSYPPVSGDRMAASADGESFVDLAFQGDGAKITGYVGTLSCAELARQRTQTTNGALQTSFLRDAWQDFPYSTIQFYVGNLVPTNDTAAEEQLDAAVAAHSPACAGAEQPDPGTK